MEHGNVTCQRSVVESRMALGLLNLFSAQNEIINFILLECDIWLHPLVENKNVCLLVAFVCIFRNYPFRNCHFVLI